MSKSYWEKLQDPRWQKKRLEAMSEVGFRCELCYDDSNPLNVHHKEYFKGHEPWEYDNNQLSVLCKTCHERLHDEFDLYKWVGSYANVDGPDNRQDLAFILCGYLGHSLEDILSMAGIESTPYIRRCYYAGISAAKFIGDTDYAE